MDGKQDDDGTHPEGIVPDRCAVRASKGGRVWFVEGPPNLGDGACYGRELLCECRSGETADRILKAVECHDVLLAALRAARRTMQNEWHNKPRIGMEDVCKQVDDAIAKAAG